MFDSPFRLWILRSRVFLVLQNKYKAMCVKVFEALSPYTLTHCIKCLTLTLCQSAVWKWRQQLRCSSAAHTPAHTQKINRNSNQPAAILHTHQNVPVSHRNRPPWFSYKIKAPVIFIYFLCEIKITVRGVSGPRCRTGDCARRLCFEFLTGPRGEKEGEALP